MCGRGLVVAAVAVGTPGGTESPRPGRGLAPGLSHRPGRGGRRAGPRCRGSRPADHRRQATSRATVSLRPCPDPTTAPNLRELLPTGAGVRIGSGSPGGWCASRRRLGLRNRRRRGPPGWQAATGLFNPTASRRGGGGRGSPRPCWGRGASASGHRASVSGGRDSAVSSPPPPRLRPVPPASRAEGAGGVRVLRPAARGPHMSHKVSTAHYAESANCPFST